MPIKLPQEFHPVEERVLYDWVENGCNGSLESVSRYMPQLFESYVHICHPAWQLPDNVRHPSYTGATDTEKVRQLIPTRWSVAVKNRIPAFDGKSSWGEIGQILDNNNLSPGDIASPIDGVPPIEAIDSIEKAIATVTEPEQDCIFAFWEDYFTVNPELSYLNKTRITGMSQQEHILLQAPRSILFDYWREVLDTPNYWNPDWTLQAVWSTKRQWFYAVPFAGFSSFFGGSKEMAKILFESKEIESYELPEGHTFKY
jgi:hypothetical protein